MIIPQAERTDDHFGSLILWKLWIWDRGFEFHSLGGGGWGARTMITCFCICTFVVKKRNCDCSVPH